MIQLEMLTQKNARSSSDMAVSMARFQIGDNGVNSERKRLEEYDEENFG
jgi:hypothetical protein